MTRYLNSAFVGEGPTDYDFLPPLARRCVERLIAQRGSFSVEVGEPYHVLGADGQTGNAPADTIDRVPASGRGLDILFYHTDAGGDPSAARAQRLDRCARLARESGHQYKVVGLIPRRELEAWISADANCLVRAMGFNADAVEVPASFSPSRVEGIFDPKRDLQAFSDTLVGNSRRRRPRPVRSYFATVAEKIDIGILVQVPAFRRFYSDLSQALIELGIVH
jgi:hypothetical protein